MTNYHKLWLIENYSIFKISCRRPSPITVCLLPVYITFVYFVFFINWTQAYHCCSMKISFTDRSEKSFMQVIFTILSLYLLMVIATISWLFSVDIMTICKTETEKNEFIPYIYIYTHYNELLISFPESAQLIT